MIYLIMVLAYLLGSVSFSVIAGFLITGEDIRNQGSGNAGATNVFRVLGWRIAIPVLLADFLKGFLPVFFASSIMSVFSLDELLLSVFQPTILFFVVLGHVFPFWFRFKGGKGVATAAGGISALFPLAVPICLFVFVLIISLTRYVSLASLVSAWFLPLLYSPFIFFAKEDLSIVKLLFFIVIAILISFLHRSNIERLLKGEESKTEWVNKIKK